MMRCFFPKFGGPSVWYDKVRYDVMTADERVGDDVDFIFHFDSDTLLVGRAFWALLPCFLEISAPQQPVLRAKQSCTGILPTKVQS